MKSNKWTLEEEIFIRDNYFKYTSKKLGILLDRTQSAVQAKIFTLKLPRKTHQYHVNNDFFKDKNSISCYWAGFIAADGCIRDKLNNICITLAEKDKNHLFKLIQNCEYTGKIKEHTYKNKKVLERIYPIVKVVRLDICGNKQWVSNLLDNFNVGPRKSLTLIPPNNINIIESISYIKGIIDGDGTLYCDENGRLQLSIVGTKEILEWIADLFEEICPIKYQKHRARPRHRKDRTTKNHYTLKITGFRAYLICKEILKVDCPGLERKWSEVNKQKTPKYKNKYLTSQEMMI